MRRATFHGIFDSAFCVLVLALTSLGCSQAERTADTTAVVPAPLPPADDSRNDSSLAIDKPRLDRIEVGAATPVHQFGRYYLAGQPAKEDFATWKDKGVRTVISLRTPGEIDWDEKAAVEALGMKFVSIPFRRADSLGDQQIEAALAELREGGEGVLLHCGSSNRVGAIWYAHRIRNDGITPEAALAEAKTIGLRDTSLTDVVDAYCESAAHAK